MKVTIVKKRMRDRVAMPRVETLWEKAVLDWAQPTDHEVVWDHPSSGGVGLGKKRWSDGAI